MGWLITGGPILLEKKSTVLFIYFSISSFPKQRDLYLFFWISIHLQSTERGPLPVDEDHAQGSLRNRTTYIFVFSRLRPIRLLSGQYLTNEEHLSAVLCLCTWMDHQREGRVSSLVWNICNWRSLSLLCCMLHVGWIPLAS